MWQAFDVAEFDPTKSDEVLELRGFDLAHASRLFPGYVLEQKGTYQDYGERRFKVIGELMGDVIVAVSTIRNGSCCLSTAWMGDRSDAELWNSRYA